MYILFFSLPFQNFYPLPNFLNFALVKFGKYLTYIF